VLAQSWVSIAAWFPPKHFGNVDAQQYVNRFVSDRYNWNLALWEPDGPGSGGREAAICAFADTLQDVERMLLGTVDQLAMGLESYELHGWHKRWEAARRRAN
jgi:hypothetical protein